MVLFHKPICQFIKNITQQSLFLPEIRKGAHFSSLKYIHMNKKPKCPRISIKIKLQATEKAPKILTPCKPVRKTICPI